LKPLPDTSKWQPKNDRRLALSNTRLQTCRSVEARIRAESDIEKNFNIHNFDSGPGIEDIVRDQMRMLLPDRYGITPGVVIDDNGDNCGECDLLIVNRLWEPLLKYGATDESRRVHVPVEAVYTVLEIKQTLTESSLDDAMEKLVRYKRLKRDRSEYGRLIENHNIQTLDRSDASLNYRFDAVLGVGCNENTEQTLRDRFFTINRDLPQADRVNAMVILGSGYARYLDEGPEGQIRDHLYPESDMAYLNGFAPARVIPAWTPTTDSSLYYFYSDLLHHLNLTVLNFGWQKGRYAKSARSRGEVWEVTDSGA
jgi:hypothetical protein